MQARYVFIAAVVLVAPTLGGAVLPRPLVAFDQAAEVLQKVRAALGGEAALDQVQAIAAKGVFRRELGLRQAEGTMELTIERPGRMYRSEDMAMPGGASVERIQALDGDASWEDVQNRGAAGDGGGMNMRTQMVFRGPNGEPPNPEQMAAARTRRMKQELDRYLLAFFASSDTPMTYAGVAEAPEGRADVLELKDERGQAARLFVDQVTSMPLMITYSEIRPRMIMTGGARGPGRPGGPRPPDAAPAAGTAPGTPVPPPGAPAGPGPDASRPPGPPPVSTVNLFLADYQEVRGVKLPHRITESVEGKPVMEWTIEKLDVNPKIKAGLFAKK